MMPRSQKRSSSFLGASLPFQKSSRIWKGFLGIWDLYEIPENAKFLDGIRDLTTTRQAGFPKIFARDVVLEKKMVFGMIKMTEVPVAGLSATAKDPPFQTLTTVFIRISAQFQINTHLE